MQVVHVETAKFTGDVLVVNHEAVRQERQGRRLAVGRHRPAETQETVGELRRLHPRRRPPTTPTSPTRPTAPSFGRRAHAAYLVATDDDEAQDVDIFDVTNPKKPVPIGEFDLNDFDVAQPDLGLDESFLHDMVVKQIDGHWIMLLSYWDGGYVLLNVDDPANPIVLSDTDFAAIDPELFESTGASLTPEGNAPPGRVHR